MFSAKRMKLKICIDEILNGNPEFVSPHMSRTLKVWEKKQNKTLDSAFFIDTPVPNF